ncbi:MAG: preprotein translocase subunit SecA [Elusimicrobiaceae bacterium]|nr:preprotein translocase subunit SecA [Elusimicrobiaceae bacterium]MBT4007791.1 preprotein translocase subunit SecA [Elusimicrobiaceae bacterium]MBT4403320.1 preprotein translocase subunit SecA [Elusimicrobiaceae bacterium]MBT4440374.1 preprotein translocase subunit SecA [Elusimicrobiaceae bacterium]MBT5987111.1 preprotein translocase subunit SecA [Elusimicrobiaceae bacterium]
MKKTLDKLFGTKSQKDLKKIKPLVEQINALEPSIEKLSDDDLKAKTQHFKTLLADGKTLDNILPEAFAVVREAGKRVLKMRHYDVQLLGGIVLHQGKIAEMKTGEGKTLVATLPAYLNGLSGKGVYIVTVNEYLAKRDSEWMGPVFEFLGLTVGYISSEMRGDIRKNNHACDITYITNNELGFDYLRDNMVVKKEQRVLSNLNFCIIDEVDSILIDEARTPLIISGPAEESTEKYAVINKIVPNLKVRLITEKDEVRAKYEQEDLAKGYDAIIDEKNHTATLTDEGVTKAERFLGIDNLYNDVSSEWAHLITQALRAHHLYEKDVNYIVKDGEIVIVDEFTGRLMAGRRWSDGLHQAVEAKERIQIKEENQTLASITFQNFFKLFTKLSGMTGTAMTEISEFWEIYRLDAVEVEPNKPCVRKDYPDLVYKTEKEKFNAVVDEVSELYKQGQPVLVGTRSIEKSEKLGNMLKSKGIPHKVLNAKHHEMEAQIISQAGAKSAVTIATNMAGRGTDIVLGGNPINETDQKHVLENGGLHVLGTERHESRRIDNQLRGRCARQGDAGSSRFYMSLNDELLRLFGSDRISFVMEKLGMEEGQAIESKIITKQIEGAQRKVEGHNFDIRKHLLDYDKVMNQQRKAIYSLRNAILDGEDVSDRIMQMIEEVIDESFANWASDKNQKLWDFASLNAFFTRVFTIDFNYNLENVKNKNTEELAKEVLEKIQKVYKDRATYFKEQEIDFKEIEQMLLLQVIDQSWKHHLHELDHLQKSVSLRAYGQKDPLIEYQKESFAMYQTMFGRIRDYIVDYIFKMQLPPKRSETEAKNLKEIKKDGEQGSGKTPDKSKLGRNDPCPCGSGKKYKKCCMR